MNIGDLKKYLIAIPEECDEYELVIRDLYDENKTIKAFDTPINMMMTDDNNECLCFLDQSSAKIVKQKLLPKTDN